MASVKAVEAAYGVSCLPAARRIRELIYHAFFVADHATHFYCLGGPDFLVGPDAPAAERNVLGVIRKAGLAVGQGLIDCRRRNHELIKQLGGRGIHPCGGVPGGWSVPLSREQQIEFSRYASDNVAFAQSSLKLFDEVVLRNQSYRDMVMSDLYHQRTHCMGTVDETMASRYYDGLIRVVDTAGEEVALYEPKEYLAHIAERVEPWSYLKFPYLKRFGWQGFVDGQQSGIYQATPLARLNVADRLGTPLAQAEFERFYDAFGALGKAPRGRNRPVHHQLATHWARLIELLHAAERMKELTEHPEICDPMVRQACQPRSGQGVGSVEAPRGTLIHHYETDDRGVITGVNLVVGTTNNNAPISLSVMKAAKGLIRNGAFTEGILNRVEMAFRLYDPCCSCATHALGLAPLEVLLRRQRDGAVLDHASRGC